MATPSTDRLLLQARIAFWTRYTQLRKLVGQPKQSEVVYASQPNLLHLSSVIEAVKELQSSLENGLDEHLCRQRFQKYGPNELSVKEAPKFLDQVFESLQEPLLLLLLGSSFLSLILGNYDDALSIFVAISIVVIIQTYQTRKSNETLASLSKIVPVTCSRVRSKGRIDRCSASLLVPGDVVLLQTGDRIPADLILAAPCTVDEAILTGETHSMHRKANERVHMGTLVKSTPSGALRAVVLRTGRETSFGETVRLMSDVTKARSPLQVSMDALAHTLTMLSFGVIGFIVLLGLLQRRNFLDMITIAVSLAVAAIPEGLPIVTTVTLALGVQRMVKRKAIVKSLPAVESLGCVDVLCSDKTGTLTCNSLEVAFVGSLDIHKAHDVKLGSHDSGLERLMQLANLVNDAQPSVSMNIQTEQGATSAGSKDLWQGHSTDVALMKFVTTLGLPDIRRADRNRDQDEPFSSETKYQAVYHKGRVLYKGATEIVSRGCEMCLTAQGSMPLDGQTKSKILHNIASMESQGLRVIAFAEQTAEQVGSERRTWVGWVALQDPPRPGVKEAVDHLQKAGIRVVMITGDSSVTAQSIASQLGLIMSSKPQLNGHTNGNKHAHSSAHVLTGLDLDSGKWDPEARIFARTTPKHKLEIVRRFQEAGRVVAMTGDGVNDAPATKAADIGICMGSGTDVSKEAADVILVNDYFGTVISAVEEGKSIFYNIQNFLAFQLSTAAAALSLITISTLLHMPNPLNAMQILFINIIMDGPPSQSLGVDPVNRQVMSRPPRTRQDPILTDRLYLRTAFSASIILLGVLAVYSWEYFNGFQEVHDQTMTFTAFVFLDLVSALQNRGIHCTLSGNKILLGTVLSSALVQLSLIYFPILQGIFQTEALPLLDMLVLCALAATSFGLHQFRREYERQLDDKMSYSKIRIERLS